MAPQKGKKSILVSKSKSDQKCDKFLNSDAQNLNYDTWFIFLKRNEMGSFEKPKFRFWGPNQDRIKNLIFSNLVTQILLFQYPIQISWQIKITPPMKKKFDFGVQIEVGSKMC